MSEYSGSAPSAVAEKRILIVDDDRDIRGLIARMLSAMERSVTVYQAQDGREAIGLLERAEVDLLITDLRMPGLDGYGLLRWVRDDARFHALPVLVMSSVGPEEFAEVSGGVSVDGYLVKPFALTQLAATLDEVLGGPSAS